MERQGNGGAAQEIERTTSMKGCTFQLTVVRDYFGEGLERAQSYHFSLHSKCPDNRALTYIPTIRYVYAMPRPTNISPGKGDARTRLLDAARDVIRLKGFDATTVDDLCNKAEVTKGAYFHHFKTKEALGVAAAEAWSEQTGTLFVAAPYHQPDDPVERLLAYIDFRIGLMDGDLADFTCLVGTMAQVVYDQHPPIRNACGESIAGHAATLERDIALAIEACGLANAPEPASLALHIQASIQGAFVVAKALNHAERARDSLRHLRRYIELLFQLDKEQ